MESLYYTYILKNLIMYKIAHKFKPHMRILWFQSVQHR